MYLLFQKCSRGLVCIWCIGMLCTWRDVKAGNNRRMVQHVAECPPPAPAETLSRTHKTVECICMLIQVEISVLFKKIEALSYESHAINKFSIMNPLKEQFFVLFYSVLREVL